METSLITYLQRAMRNGTSQDIAIIGNSGTNQFLTGA
jgi:hypothetical protein